MLGLKTRILEGGSMARRHEIGGTCGGYGSRRPEGLAAGLVAGTWVATAMGWRAVEAVALGDLVLTFDRGLQPVRSVTRGVNWGAHSECPKQLWPLVVPAGVLGNQETMMLLPEQSVMVESDTADMLYGDPFTLLSAADLDEFRGIERAFPTGQLEVIQMHFDHDELVFADAGALVFCPSGGMIEAGAEAAPSAPDGYRNLPSDEAAMLVDCLRDEDTVACGTKPDPTGGDGYAAALA